MGKLIIDAHSHLWLKQDTTVDGKRILSLKNGRSIFMDEEVQMLPPFMIDGQNTAEVFLSNMNYAQVGAAVVVQEVIDGCQNAYLTKVQQQYPDRFFCMGMAWNTDEAQAVIDAGLKGIAFPGHRIHESLLTLMPVFKLMESKEMVLSMCLADDEEQIGQMAEVIQECPDLKVAIGHFGMPSTASFRSQVLLARQGQNVMVESGGITWLYNSEFYPFPTAIRRIREAADLVLSGHKHVSNIWKINDTLIVNAGSLCSTKLRGRNKNSYNVYNITDTEIEIFLNEVNGEKFLFGKYPRNEL